MSRKNPSWFIALVIGAVVIDLLWIAGCVTLVVMAIRWLYLNT